jgi:hypothetical protein
MKATVLWLGALLLAAASASGARANPWFCGSPQAPDACGPGYYCTNYCGAVYGPNYCLRPPWEPFNGLLPSVQVGGGQVCGFPTHPNPRSPRGFFILRDP